MTEYSIAPHLPEEAPEAARTAAGLILARTANLEAPDQHIPNLTFAANDRNFGRTILQLEDTVPDADTLRMGLVVGSGYLHSSLPELPVDVVLRVDVSTMVLAWQAAQDQVMRDSDNTEPEDFSVIQTCNPWVRAAYEREHRYYMRTGTWTDPFMNGIAAEQAGAGDRHFLSSAKRLSVCQAAHSKVPIIPIFLNLHDSKAIGVLADGIEEAGGKLTYANVSNVWEYTGDYTDDPTIIAERGEELATNLRRLPFVPDAAIAFSSLEHPDTKPYRPPASLITTGIESYRKEAESHYKIAHPIIRKRISEIYGPDA